MRGSFVRVSGSFFRAVLVVFGFGMLIGACADTAGERAQNGWGDHSDVIYGQDRVAPGETGGAPQDDALQDADEQPVSGDSDDEPGGGGGDATSPLPGDADVGGDAEVVDETLHGIVIDGPEELVTLSGSVRIVIAPAGVDEWPEVSVVVRLAGRLLLSDCKLPTDFVLDTTAFPNGEHTMEVTVRVGEASEQRSVRYLFDNPAHRFEFVELHAPNYRNGETVEITACLGDGLTGLSLTADLGALDTTFVDLAEDAVLDLADGCYLIRHTIAATNAAVDRDHPVTVTATDGEGRSVAYRILRVPLRNEAPTPLEVRGAIFVDEPMPAPTASSDRPRVTALSGNTYIVTGGSAQVVAALADPQGMPDIVGLLVGVQGFSGFFHLPLPRGGGTVPVYLRLDPNAVLPEGAQLAMRVAAVDRAGNVSEYAAHQLITIAVMSGDVQVSASWDAPTDVDLHVIEPGGRELYYSSRGPTAFGGVLDLDANAGCGGRDVRNENVSWPVGQSPAGIYTVLLKYWSNCSQSATNWTVTVKTCGDVEVFTGQFTGSGVGGGACGSSSTQWASNRCNLVAQFDNTCGFRAEGFVRYEDHTFDADGFSATTWRPLRYAVVQARRNADGVVLGTTATDRFGYYNLRFNNTGDPGYYIVVRTETDPDDGLRAITVHNHPKFSRIYEFVSRVAYEETGVTARLDLDIPIVGPDRRPQAGACNIFDVAVSGYDRIRRMTGKELGALRLFWQTGTDTTRTLYCSNEMHSNGLCDPPDSIQIQGLDRDRDEFDDNVILREVFKFAESKISATDSIGWMDDGALVEPCRGPRDDPRRAWSEGMASFFACQVRNSSVFVDKHTDGAYRVRDLAAETSPFAFGTSTGAQAGRVSEYLIAAALWGLVDDGEGGQDRTRVSALYDAALNYLGGSSYVGQRGFPGRDFVDFLDGWFCRGHGQSARVAAVLESHDFPYDFGGPQACP